MTLLRYLRRVIDLLALALGRRIMYFLCAIPTLIAIRDVRAACSTYSIYAVLITTDLRLLSRTLATLEIYVATVRRTIGMYLLRAVFLAGLGRLRRIVREEIGAANEDRTRRIRLLAYLLNVTMDISSLLVLRSIATLTDLISLGRILVCRAADASIRIACL